MIESVQNVHVWHRSDAQCESSCVLVQKEAHDAAASAAWNVSTYSTELIVRQAGARFLDCATRKPRSCLRSNVDGGGRFAISVV